MKVCRKAKRKRRHLTEVDRFERLVQQLGYDPDLACLNAKIRLMMLDVGFQDIAYIFDTSRQLIHYRFKCQDSRTLAWSADVLVVPKHILTSASPVQIVQEPMPPPGWLRRIVKCAGDGLPIEQIRKLAWGGWFEEPLSEPAFYDQDDPGSYVDARERGPVLKYLS